MNELPILVTLVLGFTGVIFSVLNQNRRFDDLKESINHRFDQVDRRFNDIERRLERLENKLDYFGIAWRRRCSSASPQ